MWEKVKTLFWDKLGWLVGLATIFGLLILVDYIFRGVTLVGHIQTKSDSVIR